MKVLKKFKNIITLNAYKLEYGLIMKSFKTMPKIIFLTVVDKYYR